MKDINQTADTPTEAEPTTFRQQYEAYNTSLHKQLVWHSGIDAGFFAEYTAMLHAMLYCLEKGYGFRLYSVDANYGHEKGWTDYFEPFCPEEKQGFHHRYNIYGVARWKDIWRMPKATRKRMIPWKLKLTLLHGMGNISAFLHYGRHIRLSHCVRSRVGHYTIPGIGIDEDYARAFTRMAEITWHFNAQTRKEIDAVKSSIHLPEDYVACQVRGGDKITETALLRPETFARQMEKEAKGRDVFVLTDDYNLFETLKECAPRIHWHTLCGKEEHGYVNSEFSQTGAQAKRKKMIRFLASMDILWNASRFVGSITSGPSLFLLKVMGDKAVPIDCKAEDLSTAFTQPIAGRSRMATQYFEKK